MVLSTWKDAFGGPSVNRISQHVQVPTFGVFTDKKKAVTKDPEQDLCDRWAIRLVLCRLIAELQGIPGQTVRQRWFEKRKKEPGEDRGRGVARFLAVIYADRKEQRLLLYAEMKLPGEAWLEFTVKGNEITQTATFRPPRDRGKVVLVCGVAVPLFYF
jgi:hypothetical protein